jgi:RNA recognition motif-containing protein
MKAFESKANRDHSIKVRF